MVLPPMKTTPLSDRKASLVLGWRWHLLPVLMFSLCFAERSWAQPLATPQSVAQPVLSEKPLGKTKEKPGRSTTPSVETPKPSTQPTLSAGMTLPPFSGEGLLNDHPPFLVGVSLYHNDLTYHEGERLRVKFTAERDAYFYLIYHQANGTSILLFPNEARTDNRVPAKKDILVPDLDDPFGFYISAPFGTEVFQCVASLKPIEELDGLVKKTGHPSVVSMELLKKLRQRLTKDLTSWAEHRVPIRTVAKQAKLPEHKPNRVGLFIGVSQSQSKKVTTLRFSRGAELMAKVLVERGGVATQNAKTLVGEKATRSNIEEAIVKWLPSVSQPGDTVFIFYAGHGATVKNIDGAKSEGRDGLLSTFDDDLGPGVSSREQAEARARDKLISDDSLARWLQELHGRQIVLMLETCHAGAMIDSRVLSRFFVQHAARVKGISQLNVVVLAACLSDESGYSDPEKPVWMAHYLADAMEKFPAPVSLRQAYEHYVQGQKQYLLELGGRYKTNVVGLQEPILVDTALLPILLVPEKE